MTDNSIISKDEGFEVVTSEKKIFFPTAELIQAGCRNCVWKLHGQCPEQYVDDQEHKNGICEGMLHFLVDLADKDDNLTAIWEKFLIYKARLQESADYKDFLELEKKIKEAEKTARTDSDFEKLEKLRMDKTAAKMWWHKLNQHAVQSMQKVRDRQVKVTGPAKLPGIYGAKTVNFNMTQPPKQLEDKNK